MHAMEQAKGYYVYQLPVRIWHWSVVLCITVLIITGYIVGKPWHSLMGDPTYLFYMGYTRMAHYIAGFILIIGLFCRVLYAFTLGNQYARELFVIPIWSPSWWRDLWHDMRWYAFLDKKAELHIGHNPMAQLGMGACVLYLIIMTFTGLGMYVQDSQIPMLQWAWYIVDIAYWVGSNGQELRSLHRLGMLLLMAFLIVHLYMVIREEIMGRTSLVSAMFSGYRMARK